MAGPDPQAAKSIDPSELLQGVINAVKPKPTPKPATAVAPAQAAVPSDVHKDGVVQQVQQTALAILENVGLGHVRALDEIGKHEVTKRSDIWELLTAAVSAAIVAASGGVAGLLVEGLVESAEAKVVASVVKKVVTRACSFKLGPKARDIDDIVSSFRDALQDQLGTARTRIAQEWSAVHDQLYVLDAAGLEAAAKAAIAQLDASRAIDIAANQTVIAWTNFLARAMHGGMAGWDPWETNGSKEAIAVSGAKDPWNEPAATRSDPTSGNVDPRTMSWALDDMQRPMMAEHYGVLEVFVDSSHRLVALPDYGMRLDNVGPKVRARLRTLGKVRDLPVNKIVRLCSYRHRGVDVDPPISIAAILITADGYVRAHNWAEFEKVHAEGGFNQCMDQLIAGRETSGCHVDHASETAEITAFADAAQNLSLTHLEP